MLTVVVLGKWGAGRSQFTFGQILPTIALLCLIFIIVWYLNLNIRYVIWKVKRTNRCSAGLRDPTWFWGSRLISLKSSDWHQVSETFPLENGPKLVGSQPTVQKIKGCIWKNSLHAMPRRLRISFKVFFFNIFIGDMYF